MSRLRRVLANPGFALGVARALAKGRFYKWWLPLTGRRFTAGRNFQAWGRLEVRGPGRVVFGDDVGIWGRVTPYTFAPDAVIEVGDRSRVQGTRFGCARRIRIGREGIIGECRIMDTDFHPLAANRRDPREPIRTLPVEIGDNVWLGTDSIVLPGASIGENSVVSVLTVCSTSYPANSIVAGNPGRAVGKVPASALEPSAEPAAPPPNGVPAAAGAPAR